MLGSIAWRAITTITLVGSLAGGMIRSCGDNPPPCEWPRTCGSIAPGAWNPTAPIPGPY